MGMSSQLQWFATYMTAPPPSLSLRIFATLLLPVIIGQQPVRRRTSQPQTALTRIPQPLATSTSVRKTFFITRVVRTIVLRAAYQMKPRDIATKP